MLFQTSIRRELARSFGATLFVLLIIVLTMMLIRALRYASKGAIGPSEVALILGFSTLAYFHVLLTLSMFICVVSTLTRMYRDSEMAVWFSSGQSMFNLLRPIFTFSLPIVLLIMALSLFGWPWANAQTEELLSRYQTRGDIERIAPGQFQESSDGSRVLYVDDDRNTRGSGQIENASKLFVFTRKDDTETVITARSGRIEQREDGAFAVLNDGQSTEINQDQTLTISHFGEYGMRISEQQAQSGGIDLNNRDALLRANPRMISTPVLFGIDVPRFQGELGWRLGMGLAALNLVLLAVASTNLNVRSSRSGGVLLALMIFVIYYNLLNYASDYISMDKAGMLPTLLVLHGGVFLFALLWLYKRQQQWTLGGWLRRRGARAEVTA